MSPPSRFLPDEPFPVYAYTPGSGDPHPVRDPRGHSYGVDRPAPPAPDPRRWRESRDYLRGVDLFNAGYYWEAHEMWEGLWNACGREGDTALLLRALIALAASALKQRAGSEAGARTHAERAARMLRRLPGHAMGLDPAALAHRLEAGGRITELNLG
jgi:hypothetical protein